MKIKNIIKGTALEREMRIAIAKSREESNIDNVIKKPSDSK